MLDHLLKTAKRHLNQHAWPLGNDLDAVNARLEPGERVEGHVRGFDGDDRLLWATTPRRLFLVESERFEREVREVWYGDVRGIELRRGRRGLALALVTTRKTYMIDGVDAAAGPGGSHEAFVAYVRTRWTESRAAFHPDEAQTTAMNTVVASPAAVVRAERVMAATRGLAELRDQGTITEQEFLSEKEKLLAER